MIRTERLELIPASIDLLHADIDGGDALGAALDAAVPESWPPDLYDETAARWTLDRLVGTAPGAESFLGYYFVLDAPDGRVLIGVGGFKGPPADGRIELGYSVVSEYRRRGLATEAVEGMLRYAFSRDDISEVVAQTLPDLTASIGVLEKIGFRLAGAGAAEGVVLYAIDRPTWLSRQERSAS